MTIEKASPSVSVSVNVSEVGWLGATAAGGASDGCRALREQLVGAICSIRSQAAMMHGLAIDGLSDPGAAGKPDSPRLLGGGGTEGPPSR
ncbi:hypothetical protein [Streptomyces adelaidensis]|uniref:hypothetical protein n=1 Tax=Streptomyces adelaidensis TaxID=2796465 RepID=UPI001902F8C0|nr:hypothetical protein [Streptomyces adelaidensis]